MDRFECSWNRKSLRLFVCLYSTNLTLVLPVYGFWHHSFTIDKVDQAIDRASFIFKFLIASKMSPFLIVKLFSQRNVPFWRIVCMKHRGLACAFYFILDKT